MDKNAQTLQANVDSSAKQQPDHLACSTTDSPNPSSSLTCSENPTSAGALILQAQQHEQTVKNSVDETSSSLTTACSASREYAQSSANISLVPSLVATLHSSHLAYCSNQNRSSRQSANNNRNLIAVKTDAATGQASTNDTFRYEEYMQLCEVHALLKKRQAVEGVLRINQKNFEDAYISAPEGGIDINIKGQHSINRAINGDSVAVLLHDVSKWKILWDMVDKFWSSWKQEIMTYVQSSKSKGVQNDNDQSMAPPPDLKFYELDPCVFSLTTADFQQLSFHKLCLQMTGKIVHIFRQEYRIFAGKIKLVRKNSSYALFQPVCSKIPRTYVSMEQCPADLITNPTRYENFLFVVEIFNWPPESRLPFGKIQKLIGNAGTIEAETYRLLLENGVDYSEFPAGLEKYLPKLEDNGLYTVPEKEVQRRTDLRKECIFTIDPITARDLDDALSIKFLHKDACTGKDVYQLGVHIADVSFFVKEHNQIDDIARQRTTSFYCVQKVIPMLPFLISQNLCSLNPNEDKLAFSVFWHIDSDGQIHKTWFARTVIRSCIKLSYELAMEMIEGASMDWNSRDGLPKVYDGHDYNEIVATINLLNKIALSLKKKRMDAGAIQFNKSAVKFMMDEEFKNPLGFIAEYKKSGYIVEEFMLLANITVAERIYEAYPSSAVLRKHDRPDAKHLEELRNALLKCDIELDITSSMTLQQSLNKIGQSQPVERLQSISFRLLKTMKQAQYFVSSEENFGTRHFALAVPYYTHFTSPIRRYPDILVHRQLAALLKLDAEPEFDRHDMEMLIERCNTKKLASRVVSETSIKLFLSMYIQSCGSLIFKSLVTQVFDRSFESFLPDFNTCVTVYTDQLKLASFQYHQKLNALDLHFQDPGKKMRRITLYERVQLRISVIKKEDPYKWLAVLAD